MKATEAKLLDFLKKSPQFIIPIYQRTYSWTERECRQLWDDIVRSGSNEKISVHFVGSIVYIESGLSQVTHQAPLLVIDGQQRLTTVTLLLAALANAVGEGEPIDGFSARKIRNYFLLNPEESGDRHFKLFLSQTDKQSLTAVVSEGEKPHGHSVRIYDNHGLFNDWIKNEKVEISTICRGLAKLVIVDVALNRQQDNPQLIFESMNSTGKELSQADLIRNFVLMGLEPKLQTRLYEQYWHPMEVEFGQEAYGTHFDAFMRHYLTVKAGEIPNISGVYDAFKDYARFSKEAELDPNVHVENLIKDIRAFARYFCAIALGAEPDGDLNRAFRDLRELKVDVAYPLLLEMYHDYVSGRFAKDAFIRAVRLVESYVFRRAICAIPTNSMNKTFGTFMKAVDKPNYLESVEAQFQLLPSYRRFPKDEEFHRDLQSRDLYHFRSRSYWLRRLENYDRKEPAPVDEYTIEHILPQNENLSAKWREDLGPDWRRVQQTWLHTLGNLTLTGYNSEYSDRSFAEKRDINGGFKHSPLKVNEGLGQLDVWNEQTIRDRASKLADKALIVWRGPKLDETQLMKYGSRKQPGSYSIQDHPHLSYPAIQPLFEAFRKEVLALDPNVTEEFLKVYVAYKAETNFVDVIPAATKLKLSLNMRFPDINDPKGICKDITGLKKHGNGDVRVEFKTLGELPYIMSLVRQSLETQLGNDANT